MVLGLAEELKQALADYTNSKGKGDITLDQEEAVAVMQEKYEQGCPAHSGRRRICGRFSRGFTPGYHIAPLQG